MKTTTLFQALLLSGAPTAVLGWFFSPQQQQPQQPIQQLESQQQSTIQIGDNGQSQQSKHYLKHIIDTSPLLSFHQDIVEIESITTNEAEVGNFIIQYLQARGFVVEKQIVGSSSINEEKKERFNIYAYPESGPTPRILLSSHIDTVPPYIPYSLDHPGSSSSSSTWRDEIRIAGRGSADAKASVATQVFATLEYLQTHPDAPLGLLFVVGEEVNGVGMQWYSGSELNTSPPTFHTVIFGEPTELALVSGHKGSLFCTVSATGKAAHSGYPWLGRSAVSALLPALVKLDKLGDTPVAEGGLPTSDKFGKSTINIGRLEAGIAGNVVPVHAEASVNIRLATDNVDEAKRILTQAVVDATNGDEAVTIKWGNNGVGHAPIGFDADVDGFNVTTVNYATDAWFLNFHKGSGGSPEGRVYRYLYGPGSILVAHGPDEAITVGDLEAAVEGYKRLIDAAVERNS
jgi:acetylornithine deacetylase